jgi:hypothetical protein
MFQSSSGAGGDRSSGLGLPPHDPDGVCHILLGDRSALAGTISRMAVLGYCEIREWSQPTATGRNGECIRVMTRRRTIP